MSDKPPRRGFRELVAYGKEKVKKKGKAKEKNKSEFLEVESAVQTPSSSRRPCEIPTGRGGPQQLGHPGLALGSPSASTHAISLRHLPSQSSPDTDGSEAIPRTIEELWDAAVAKIKDLSSENEDDQKLAEVVDELSSGTAMTETDLAGFISKLEQEMKHEGIKGKISDIFQKVVPIVNKFAIVGDVAVNCNPNPAALPWAAVRFILLNLTAGTEIRSKVVDSIAKITALFFQCTMYQGIYLGPEPEAQGQAEDAISHLRATVVEALVRSIRFLCYALRRQRQKSRAFTAAFKLPDVVGYVESLNDIGKQLFEAGDNCEKYCNTQTRAKVQELYDLVVGLGRELQEASDSRVWIELEKLLGVSSAAFDHIDNQSQAFCHPRTRIALLQEIYDWAHAAQDSQTPGTFWLQGLAGTGKSTICRTVARKLKEEGILAANFFFRRGTGDRSNGTRVFPTIAYQLARCLPSVRPHICDAIKSDPESINSFMDFQFQKLILDPLRKVQAQEGISTTLVIVIDALDECEDKNHRSTILNLLTKTGLSFLKVFITSRPELDIYAHFTLVRGHYQDLVLHRVKSHSIELDIRAVLEDDIEALRCEHNLGQPSKASQLASGWPDDRLRLLVKLSVPLFIAAATLMRMLRDPDWAESPDEKISFILESSENASSEYERLYNPVLNRMLVGTPLKAQSRAREKFAAIVGSIILLANPLSVSSLATLLGKNESVITSQLNPLRSVLDIPEEDGPIKLFHLSFRDYLVGESAGSFKVDEAEVHSRLAESCLELMSTNLKEDICQLGSPGRSRFEIDEATIKKNLPPAVQYACSYWVHHLVRSNGGVRAEDAYDFLREGFLNWLEALILMGKLAESVGIIASLESVAGAHGKDAEFSKFLHDTRRFILYFRRGIEDTPLQLYASGLVFAPTTSAFGLSQNYPKWVSQRPIVDRDWTPYLQTLEGHTDSVRCVAFSADGRLASGSADGTVKIWDPASGSCLRTLEAYTETPQKVPPNWILRLAFWRESRLASYSLGGLVKIWDPKDGTCLQTLTGYERGLGDIELAFSDDGKTLCSISSKLWITSSERNIFIHNLDTRESRQIFSIPAQNNILRVFALSRVGQLIACGEWARGDKTARVQLSRWTAAGDLAWRDLGCGDDHKIDSLTFSADGAFLVSAGSDLVRVWDTRTRECVRTLRMEVPLNGRAFEGAAIATSSSKSRLALICTSQGRRSLIIGNLAATPKADGEATAFHPNSVNLMFLVGDLSFSVDGELLAIAESWTIKIFDPAAAATATAATAKSNALQYHNTKISELTFASNSKALVSRSTSGEVRIWDSSTGVCRRTFPPISRSDFSGVGWFEGPAAAAAERAPLLALYSRGVIEIWHLELGLCVKTLTAPGPLGFLHLSADGNKIVWRSSKKSISVQDLETGQRVDIPAPKGRITASCLSSDGAQIALATLSDRQHFQVETLSLLTGKHLLKLDVCVTAVGSVAFSPSGRRLVALGFYFAVGGWIRDTETGQLLWNLEQPGGTGICAVPRHTSFINLELEYPLDKGVSVPQSLEACFTLYQISNDRAWIMRDREKLLWLPPEYRPVLGATCISGSTIAIGCRSGRAILIGLDYA